MPYYAIKSAEDFDNQLEEAGDQVGVATAQNITSLPTFRFFKNKQRHCDDVIGANPTKLEDEIKKHSKIC
ncbi:7600_t:CDS:2 [Racocetra fulgida]|uniref:7600_t:CDS:1 n=1 Tax=Racocetra fulgida TaxID=60492 RepID=A0A9N9NKR1_9GLOM|nr:7600_t:CDS:2 [Racocetra fulgida]